MGDQLVLVGSQWIRSLWLNNKVRQVSVRQGGACRGTARRGAVWRGMAWQGKDDCVSITSPQGQRGAARCWFGKAGRWSVWFGHGMVWFGKVRIYMPKSRQPKEIWDITRARIWIRDNGVCVHCFGSVALDVCHIDHIKSGKLASNADNNLRTLCRRCHVLRADKRHRGMIAKALELGIIPPNWRDLVWEG